MTKVPLIFVGPRGGYAGLNRTLVTSLLERGRTFAEVDVVRDGRSEAEQLRTLVLDVDEAVNRVYEQHTRQSGEAMLPALVGYSLGAQVAGMFAAEHPGVVSSVTLVAGWTQSHGKMHAVRDLWQSMSSSAPHQGAEAIEQSVKMAQLVFASAHAWPGSIAEDQLTRSAAEIETALRLCGHADLLAATGKITDPVLVVGCASDEFATVQQSRQLFGAITDCRYTEVMSGHMVCIERPAEIASLIESFVAKPHRYAAGSRVDGHQP